MIKTLEKTGRTEDDAINAALAELGLDRDDVSVEILERAKSGFLGIGASPAVVRVSYEAEDEPAPVEETVVVEAVEVEVSAPGGGRACRLCRSSPVPDRPVRPHGRQGEHRHFRA